MREISEYVKRVKEGKSFAVPNTVVIDEFITDLYEATGDDKFLTDTIKRYRIILDEEKKIYFFEYN